MSEMLILALVFLVPVIGIVPLAIRRAALFDRWLVTGKSERAVPNWRQSAALALLMVACFAGLWILTEFATTDDTWSADGPSLRQIARLWIVPLVGTVLFLALLGWVRLPPVSALRVAVAAMCFIVIFGLVVLFGVFAALRILFPVIWAE